MPLQERRPSIGLVVGNVEDDFSNQICKGAMRAAEQQNVNLFIFPVKYLDQSPTAQADPRQRYEYQYNVLLSYARTCSLDMLLVCLSSITYLSSPDTYQGILKSFAGLPVMLIASREEAFSSITYDNQRGLREAIQYLIEKRNCRHIGMVTTTNAKGDDLERVEIYRRTLAANGMDVEPSMIAEGEFDQRCVSAVETLLQQNPHLDAIVCANDSIAEGVYRVLKQHHIVVGQDICVLGFDDVESAALMEPPLATVRADAAALGERAVIEASEMLYSNASKADLQHPKHFLVETEFILRQSVSGVPDHAGRGVREDLAAYQNRLKATIDMNHRMNIINRDMLMFGSGDEKNYRRFLDAFSVEGSDSYYLYLFHHPCVHTAHQRWEQPDSIYLRAYRNGWDIVEPNRSQQRMAPAKICCNLFLPKERKTFILVDIYSSEEQYGVLLCDWPYPYFHYVEMLCYQISIAIKITELFAVQEQLLAEKEDMLDRLKRENLMLDDISNKDELTGILNRRGFINRISELLYRPENQGKRALMLYLDLNYLKQINDRFTHSEGNYALSSCATALEEALGSAGVAGRIGGDEFVGCVVLRDGDTGEHIKQMIRHYLKDLNANSGKPYEVTVSIGALEFPVRGGQNVSTLVERTDDLLYEDKKLKKPFVVRS